MKNRDDERRDNRRVVSRSRWDARETNTTATFPPKSDFFGMDCRQMAPFQPRVTSDTLHSGNGEKAWCAGLVS